MSHYDLPTYYGISDELAITSTYDNFPFVVLEAMAAGLPVVGTRVGGIVLQVEDEVTGLLVQSNDAEKLAGLAKERGRARRIGEMAQSRVRTQFCWSGSARLRRELHVRVLGRAS